MTHNWADYQGRFAGTWRLDSFLGDRDSKAFYTTAEIANGTPALLEVIPAAVEGAEATRRSWDRAQGLSHDGVLRVYETGNAILDDLSVFYAVVQLPDNDVGEILGERPLNPAEARSMISSVASTLEYLHSRDLQHGAVTPSNVFLVGDAFKLSVDTIAAAGKAGRQSDMRQLGSTVIEAVTRSKEAGALRKLPAPYREIVTGCLEPPGKQWTAEGVLATLSGAGDRQRSSADGRRWMLPVALAVAVVALLGYWFTRKSPEEAAASKPVEQQTASVPATAAPPVPASLKPSPLTPGPTRTVERPTDRHTAVRPGGSASWSVIAATYNSFSGAQHRASQIAKVSPQLKTSVYPPDGQGKTYYVVLGSGLSQEAATDLRDRARRLGAPGDTYVTRLGDK